MMTPLRPPLREHRVEAWIPGGPFCRCQGPCRGCGIDDGHERRAVLGKDVLDMPLADCAGAEHRNLDRTVRHGY